MNTFVLIVMITMEPTRATGVAVHPSLPPYTDPAAWATNCSTAFDGGLH